MDKEGLHRSVHRHGFLGKCFLTPSHTDTEVTGAVIQEMQAASPASKETRHSTCDADFPGMKDARVWMLQNFTIRLQNATEPSQCVAGLDALHGTLV